MLADQQITLKFSLSFFFSFFVDYVLMLSSSNPQPLPLRHSPSLRLTNRPPFHPTRYISPPFPLTLLTSPPFSSTPSPASYLPLFLHLHHPHFCLSLPYNSWPMWTLLLLLSLSLCPSEACLIKRRAMCQRERRKERMLSGAAGQTRQGLLLYCLFCLHFLSILHSFVGLGQQKCPAY